MKWAGASLFVLLVITWVASVGFDVERSFKNGWGVMVGWGMLRIEVPSGPATTDQPGEWSLSGHLPEVHWWFEIKRSSAETLIFIPLWVAAAPVLLATAVAWRSDTLARRRARVGHCRTCGYDLSATPAGAKCPECGKAC